ncbi:MAG: cohesin domain-containing protein [Patescibacteria group bacterium]|nr:cohesin domain-containing protein [Patescibacteria group bacterium]
MAPQEAVAQATPSASLYFSPASGTLEVNKPFSISLMVKTGGNAINLIEANLSFSKNLQVISLSKSGTILSLWFNEPSFSNPNGTISFSGGIPNPGFNGSGRVLTINFKVKSAGSAWVTISSAQVLANDGFGTNILKNTSQANFTLYETGLPKPAQPPPLQPVKPEPPSKVKIFSSTHPEETKWYQEKNIILSWTWQSGITDYSYILDQKPETVPDNSGEGLNTSTAYLNLNEGIWYFHLKAKNEAGWGETNHFKIQIDTTPPVDLQITVDEGHFTYNPAPTLRFSAKDELSGTDYYTVKILENPPIQVKENYLQIPKQKPGDLSIAVRAYDKAGNYSEKNLMITIEPIPIPKINYYQKELLVSETLGSLVVRGIGLPGAKIKLYLNHESGKTLSAEEEVQENGHWGITYSQVLLPGQYSGYAIAMIGEEESRPSKEIEVKVVKNGLRFLFWIIPPTMVWSLIAGLAIWALGVSLTLCLGIKRKFRKCDFYLRKFLSSERNQNQ